MGFNVGNKKLSFPGQTDNGQQTVREEVPARIAGCDISSSAVTVGVASFLVLTLPLFCANANGAFFFTANACKSVPLHLVRSRLLKAY